MLMRHAIGGALRRVRLARGLTLRDLSQASRVSIPYLSEIERGRKEPSSEILATICRVFDMTILDLVDAVSGELRASHPAVLVMGSSVDTPPRSFASVDRGSFDQTEYRSSDATQRTGTAQLIAA